MLHSRFFKAAKLLGCATKLTFAQGHGYSLEEVKILEKERLCAVKSLRSENKDEWHIPRHILSGQAFSYETELFSFLRRIGCHDSYITEDCRAAGEKSLLSSAVVVALGHHSTCKDKRLLELKHDICNVGKLHLSSYIMQYFKLMFPNIASEILHKLSCPESCFSKAKCYSLYKHLCLHELIRCSSTTTLTLEDYSDALGGIFLSILLFDNHSFISAPSFIQSCILNYYTELDFRDLIDFDSLSLTEKKLSEVLKSSGYNSSPEIRIISIDGEESPVPTFNVGVFVAEECLGSAADISVESASLHASNASLTNLLLSKCNTDVTMKNLDFDNLPDGLSSKKVEIEEQLNELLDGIDLSKSERATNAEHRTVFTEYSNLKKLEELRPLRYR